jgi:TonB-linked SusC/RagA family outer membrane protein
MRWTLSVCLIALLLPFSAAQAQQQGAIAGTVTDDAGAPLAGAQVSIVGMDIGTLANDAGRYLINDVPAGEVTVRVTLLGYGERDRTVTVVAGETLEVNFQLSVSAIELEGIVAVGYGTQRKVNLTGAVASMETEEMTKLPVPTVTHALQGMAPGVQLLDGGDRPGRNQLDLLIRGQGTLGRGGDQGSAAASRPLVLIDGLEGDLATVNMEDVASISVLKDAASAAIYGSRAANGVILVTTKRGAAAETAEITYSGYIGMQDITAWPERVSTVEHMRLANLARSNYLQWCQDGRHPTIAPEDCINNPSYAPRYTEEYIQNTIAGTDPDAYPSNEWVDAIFDPAPIQDHTLRVSGGTAAARYALSLNYLREDGMMANTGHDRYGVRLNTDFAASDKITAGVDLSGSRRWDVIPAENWASTFYIIHDTPPTRRTRYSDGTYGLNLFGRSPLASAEISGDEQRIFWSGTVTGRLNYDIFPQWAEIQTLASVEYGAMDWERFRTDPRLIDEYPQSGYNWGPNFGENRSNTSIQTTMRAMVDYGHTFMETHDVSGVIGYEQIAYQFEEFRAWRDQFYNNELRQLNLGNAVNDGNLGYGSEWALRSVYGRLNYSLLGRYLFEFNARYDGSSRFAEGHRFGFFPSFSAGWRISEEPFFNVGWIDELKLRGSWGQLGNQDVPLYTYYSSIDLGLPYYLGNASGTQATGGAATSLTNEELSWETTTVTDFGFDAAFLRGRLNVSGDYYIRRTEDILLRLPIPDLVGLTAPYQNAGIVENKGWELAIGWQDEAGDFRYGVDFNLSDNRNEVVDLVDTGPYIQGSSVIREGAPINSWYGWEVTGLFSSYEEIDSHAQPAGQETHLGDLIFKDQNGDGVINDADRVIIGNPNPRYIFGMNLSAGWKNFDASAFIQGIGKRDQYLSLGFIQGPVWENYTSTWHRDYWTPENQDARMPAYYSNYNRNYYATNSWWILDGSFVKLRNLQVGYTLPDQLSQRMGVTSMRLYVTGKNLWMHQNLGIDLDPEYPWTRADYYPQSKVFSIGTDISF